MKPAAFILGPALAVTLLCAGTQAGSLSVEPAVVSGGGGLSASTRFHLTGTIGQPVATSADAGLVPGAVRSGFWTQVLRWINGAPVPAADSLTRRPGEGAHILISSLLGNAADPELDPLTFVGFAPQSASGGTVRRDGPWLVYQPAPGADPTATDSLTYYITDGGGIPVAGVVQIVQFVPVDSGPPNSLAIVSDAGPPARVLVRFQGIAARTYRVQFAPAVSGPWTDLGPATASATGRIDFADPVVSETRFYRLVETP